MEHLGIPLRGLACALTLGLTAAAAAAHAPVSLAQESLPATVLPGVEAEAGAAAPDAVPDPWHPIRIEAFFDGLIRAQMENHDVAGATVAVVKDGAVLLAKGYGWHDVEQRREVDAATSLFRIGSISKTFTWTAIMQLVEQGRIDLDDDINDYLEEALRVPATYDEPIRIRHLLTHTPGFEDQVIGLFGRDAASIRPLGEILLDEMPARVRPPGSVASYSNHGTGIAGYIVEQVSGLPWDEYVEQRILQPLGMSRTSFRQPLPEALVDGMSGGYSWSDADGFEPEGFEFVPLAPVGSASSSAADMARWMMAHLNLGELDGNRILGEAAARQMQSDLFRHAPQVNATAHGFYEMSTNGERVIGHGGDTLWFHSDMALVPEHRIGMFVSFNSAGGGAAKGLVFPAFMDEFFPVEEPAPLEPPPGFAERADRYLGHYRANRYSHRTLAKLGAIGTVEITLTDEGELRTSNGPTRFVEVEPLVFRARDEPETLVFRENEEGVITHVFLGSVPILAFEKVGFWGDPGLQGGVAAFSAAMLLGAFVLWPVAAMLRRRHGYRVADRKRLPRRYKPVAWFAATLLVVFVLGGAAALSDINGLVFGDTSGLGWVLTLPLLAMPLAVVTIWFALRSWVDRSGSLSVRFLYSMVALALVGAYWLLAYWNLLGYRY